MNGRTTSFHDLHRRGTSDSGQTTSEYAIVLAVLVPGAVLLFTGLGNAVINLITSVAGLLP